MLKINRKNIGNWILIIALFLTTNLEWNYYNVYVKVGLVDLVILLAALAASCLCYYDKEVFKSKSIIIFGMIAVISVIACVIMHKYVIALLALIALLCFYLVLTVKFNKVQFLIVTFWMSLFFYYWTFDVKGYFKGYDVYYGSMILLQGVIFSFILIEYFKYWIKEKYIGKNVILVFFKSHIYLIGFYEAFLVLWAYNIMTWYQSTTAFIMTALFVVLMIIPYRLSLVRGVQKIISRVKKEAPIRTFNYFVNLVGGAALTFGIMFVIALNRLDIFSAPFILAFICLFAIIRYFSSSSESEEYHVFYSNEHRNYIRKNAKNNVVVGVCAVFTGLFPVLILGPLENYYANIGDFEFYCRDFFYDFIIITIVSCLFVVVLGLILRKESFKLICTVLFSIGVTSYIQVMFMNKRMATSNGSAMDFESLGNYPYYNILIWGIVLIAICIILVMIRDDWQKIVVIVGGCLCLVQLVAAVSLPLMSHSKDNYKLSAKDEFQVSKENIIVFVLDTFGNAQFNDGVEKFPEATEGFEDFKRYTNADCTYAWTWPSFTHMFTGYSDNESLKDGDEKWSDVAWKQESVKNYYEKLHNAGYMVNLYGSNTPYLYGYSVKNLLGRFDNVKEYEIRTDRQSIVKKMFRFSLYKVVPYVFKPRFECLTEEFSDLVEEIHEDGDEATSTGLFLFKRHLDEGLSLSENCDKQIKIFLLEGMHGPLCMTKDFEKEYGVDRSEVVYANLKMMNIWLDEMKRLGVYDSSTIIITADHGTYIDVIDPQPILLVKEKNASHDKMEESTAPVSHNELMATILDCAGIEYSEYGNTYSEIEKIYESKNREREVGYLAEDWGAMNFYTYEGDVTNLLKKFPDVPDYAISLK